MKIIVIGGSGLIGSNIFSRLAHAGHEAVVASPTTGVDAVTGQGLAAVLVDAQVVVDAANSPSFEDRAVHEFFDTSSRNLLAAEAIAGVQHHVVLSVVGADRLPKSGYLRAKVAQENLVKASGSPYSIVRSTQFFESIVSIIRKSAHGDTIHLSPALVQPVAADDTASMLADLTLGIPINNTVEVAGPELFPFDEFARKFLAANGYKHQVIADVHAGYFGTELNDRSLVAGDDSCIGPTHFDDWLSRYSRKDK